MPEMVHYTCANCGNPYSYTAARVREYRKRFEKDPAYCSRACWAAGTLAKNTAAAKFICAECGTETPYRRHEYIDKTTGKLKRSTYVRKQRYCSQTCANTHTRRVAAERFLAGETPRHIQGKAGYARIIRPLSITGKRQPIYEHRIVMARTLGRNLLSHEHVHHLNGNRADNRPENLELWSKRQPAGQRVIDKIAFAIEMLRLYPDFAAEQGVKLVEVEHSD